MKTIPKIIQVETGEVLGIERYEDGRFIIINSPTIVEYNIDTGQFLTIKNGIKVPFGVSSIDPELYRKWKQEYEDNSRNE